ncbi:MAG TPA: ATP-dependent DNA ligase, partial [Clostridia bacterium]|nr:ATP-dependent DNA ligase [Clostridia bacterium]
MLALAQLAEAMGSTTRKTQKVALLAEYLRSVDEDTAALSALYLSGRVFAAWEERTLQVGGAQLWRTLLTISGKSDAALTAAFRRYGDLGAAAHDVLLGTAPETATLTVLDIARTFDAIATARGPAAKGELLRTLLAHATALQAKYLIKIMTGELRIGLKESLVEEATAKAFDASLADVKRANMLLGDIGETVRLAVRNRLPEARMRLFHPIGFMLAAPAEDAVAAFEQFSESIVEDKYDGIRAQAHVCPARSGNPGRVKIYSRTLDEIGESFPELPPALAGLVDEAIFDGEILAWRGGRALAFSELQKRLGRKRVTQRTMSDVPVAYVVFDILALNGELVIDRPLRERRELLADVLSRLRPPDPRPTAQGVLAFETVASPAESSRVLPAPALRATSAEHLDELFAAAQDRGNEGLMIKDAASTYTPGRRGQSWLKLKRELATLDVVVTA